MEIVSFIDFTVLSGCSLQTALHRAGQAAMVRLLQPLPLLWLHKLQCHPYTETALLPLPLLLLLSHRMRAAPCTA